MIAKFFAGRLAGTTKTPSPRMALLLTGILCLPTWSTAQQGEQNKPAGPSPAIDGGFNPADSQIVKVKISAAAKVLIDQPITFTVEVQHPGTLATDKDFALVVETGSDVRERQQMREQLNGDIKNANLVVDLPIRQFVYMLWRVPEKRYVLHVGELKPGATRTVTFQATSRRARQVKLSVFQGQWYDGRNQSDDKPAGMMTRSNVADVVVEVQYDANAPLSALLPRVPGGSRQPLRLPQSLAEVPEICFQEPLTKTMEVAEAQLHNVRVIDKIHFLNRKKTDAFMELLIGNRPDLAGLPFVLGDDCRLKRGASQNLVNALAHLRSSQSAMAAIEAENEAMNMRPEKGPDKRHDKEERTKTKPKRLMEFYTRSGAGALTPEAEVASLMQVLGPEAAKDRYDLAGYLGGVEHADAAQALARLAIYSEEEKVRFAAVDALKRHRHQDYDDILMHGLHYPWPAVAERSGQAIARLGLTHLAPKLIEVLDRPDPRAPTVRQGGAKQTNVVRDVVRLNHLHNCLLCHAPAARDANLKKEEAELMSKLTAQVPVPSEPLTAYYRPSVPDLLVRLDVTYLRQDFSLSLPVANADPWPAMQRFDFVVRTREVSQEEACAIRDLLQQTLAAGVDGRVLSPYQRAAHEALRELTGLDPFPTARAWNHALMRFSKEEAFKGE